MIQLSTRIAELNAQLAALRQSPLARRHAHSQSWDSFDRFDAVPHTFPRGFNQPGNVSVRGSSHGQQTGSLDVHYDNLLSRQDGVAARPQSRVPGYEPPLYVHGSG
jgi:hypothetical protein